jgi:hypothetical protein
MNQARHSTKTVAIWVSKATEWLHHYSNDSWQHPMPVKVKGGELLEEARSLGITTAFRSLAANLQGAVDIATNEHNLQVDHIGTFYTYDPVSHFLTGKAEFGERVIAVKPGVWATHADQKDDKSLLVKPWVIPAPETPPRGEGCVELPDLSTLGEIPSPEPINEFEVKGQAIQCHIRKQREEDIEVLTEALPAMFETQLMRDSVREESDRRLQQLTEQYTNLVNSLSQGAKEMAAKWHWIDGRCYRLVRGQIESCEAPSLDSELYDLRNARN